jgi:hypothetical protein
MLIIYHPRVDQSLTDVWHLIKLPSFSKWWSALESSEVVKGASDEADVYRFAFKVSALFPL